MFLKLMQLTPPQRRFRGPKDRVDRWLSFVEWMLTEIPSMSAREWFTVCEWFLGPTRPASEQKHLIGLLKFQPKRLVQNAWGAAWDMFFVRLLDGDLTSELADDAAADLITADSHFLENRRRVATHATAGNRPGTLGYRPAKQYDVSLEKWASEIDNAFLRVRAWQLAREASFSALNEDERSIEVTENDAIISHATDRLVQSLRIAE